MEHLTAEQRRAELERRRAESAERRERVMRYPDLVARLVRLGMNPDTWTGYIPPRNDPEGACATCEPGTCTHPHSSRANRSFVRRELVDVAAEALRRDTQPAFDEVQPDLARDE